jgi:hypothetical protein
MGRWYVRNVLVDNIDGEPGNAIFIRLKKYNRRRVLKNVTLRNIKVQASRASDYGYEIRGLIALSRKHYHPSPVSGHPVENVTSNIELYIGQR